MSLVEQLHAARKERLARMSSRPKQAKPVDTLTDIAGFEPRRVNPAQNWLDQYEPFPEPTYPTVQRIKERVCEFYNVSIVDLVSARRTKDVVLPRHVAMYLVRNLTPRSFPDIARKFGHRDHATPIHAVQKIERLMQTDLQLAATVAAIKASLQ